MDRHPLKHIIEAALLTAGKPLSMQHLQALLGDDDETPLAKEFVQAGLDALSNDLEDRGIELKLVASGYRLQVRQSLEPWIARLFEERPPRYSRALLETLALIGYRQPITRAEIEEVRGVSVSSNIIRTLLEREWIKVVGHRDVPGRPSMYGTTKQFLDYFNLKSLAELPELGELMDLEKASAEFDKANGDPAANDDQEADAEAGAESTAGESQETAEGESTEQAEPSAEGDEADSAEASADTTGEATEQAEQTDATASADQEDNSSNTVSADESQAEQPAEAAESEAAEVEAESEADLLDENGESQEDIDADVDSLIAMLDAEIGEAPASDAAVADADNASPSNPEDSTPKSSQHEAARGESITPADLLRRHSTVDIES